LPKRSASWRIDGGASSATAAAPASSKDVSSRYTSMLSTRTCPVGVRVSRRRQPTSVTADSDTTRSEEVIEPGGPSPGGTSSPCHRTSRVPSQTTTSCQTPLTSLTNRSRVNPRTEAPRSTPESASSAISGSRR
jgi:hypothetical protein